MSDEDYLRNIIYCEEEVFKSMAPFDIAVEPKNYLHRREQMNALANNIRPAIFGFTPIHTIILGKYATGKTTAIKRLFRLISEGNDKVVTVYINCKKHSRHFKICSIIYEKVFGRKPPKKGSSYNHLFDKIMEELDKENKVLLIAFDDANYLLDNIKSQNLFYDFLRAYESYNVAVSIFPILKSLEVKYKFEQDVRTVFIPEEVVFPDYSYDEVYDILDDRCKAGFYEGVINQGILSKICECVIATHNLRLGLNMLMSLGNKAQMDGTGKIKMENLKKLIKSLQK